MENLRLGVSAVRHDMKREETVEEAEKNTELGRQTPKNRIVRILEPCKIEYFLYKPP